MLVQIEDWRQYMKEGGQYLRTAVNASEKRAEVFTPEILYNLTAMAIEKYLMGYLMYHGDLADNHTMADLLQAIKRHVGIGKKFGSDLCFIDSFQEICHLDTYSRKKPTRADLKKILTIGRNVQRFVGRKIKNAGRYPDHH